VTKKGLANSPELTGFQEGIMVRAFVKVKISATLMESKKFYITILEIVCSFHCPSLFHNFL